MSNLPTGLLTEKGTTSSMRLTMMFCAVAGCFIAYTGIKEGTTDLMGLAVLVGVIIGGPVAGKVAQKGKERD